jgi:hypothetical protein
VSVASRGYRAVVCAKAKRSKGMLVRARIRSRFLTDSQRTLMRPTQDPPVLPKTMTEVLWPWSVWRIGGVGGC